MVKTNLSDIDIAEKLSDMWAPLNNEQREFWRIILLYKIIRRTKLFIAKVKRLPI